MIDDIRDGIAKIYSNEDIIPSGKCIYASNIFRDITLFIKRNFP